MLESLGPVAFDRLDFVGQVQRTGGIRVGCHVCSFAVLRLVELANGQRYDNSGS